MKKIVGILLSIVIVLMSLCFAGCEKKSIKVESIIHIDNNFNGTRIISVKFPFFVQIDDITDALIEKSPANTIENVNFTYLGVQEDGYDFELDIDFFSKNDYCKKISKLIGREANVYLSQPDSVLAKGIRMKEDFDVSNLISWIMRIVKNNSSTSSLDFDFSDNTVTVNNSIYSTSSTNNISQRSGIELDSITIDTSNFKDSTYNRTVTFSIPQETYKKVEHKLIEYFDSHTSENAEYSGWELKGNNYEYKVIFSGVTISQLKEYTSLLLDSKDCSMFYGDMNNTSTPLSEGLNFEERFNTFSFIGENGMPVKVIYTYSLPSNTTHGEGAIKSKGTWKQKGKWKNDIYFVTFTDDVINVRIPDGIQYEIEGINFLLQLTGNNIFSRSISFMFSKNNTQGIEYATTYFENKGANSEITEDENHLICTVYFEGTPIEISEDLVNTFGSGNYITYEVTNNAFSLSSKTNFVEYINIGYMLNQNNLSVPMTYEVKSFTNENVNAIYSEGLGSKFSKSGNSISIDLINGEGVIEYKGTISKPLNIVLFVIVSFLLLVASIFIIFKMNKTKKVVRRNNESYEEQTYMNNFEVAPEQTTMFSIKELKELAEKSQKDIDKDIEDE